MATSKSPKKAHRSQPPTRDLQPRDGQAVRGGKKAVSEVKVTQQQIEAGLQELQS
jgi:hypothetical protein